MEIYPVGCWLFMGFSLFLNFSYLELFYINNVNNFFCSKVLQYSN